VDTCGETPGVALWVGQQFFATDFSQGNASATIVTAIRNLLAQSGCRMVDLDAVGVVTGPGSFTGMRIGLAVAKGLCESVGTPLAAVSRLEVLADAAGLSEGLVALDAGRGGLYVRDMENGLEWLCSSGEISKFCRGKRIAVAQARAAERLAAYEPMLCPLHAADALPAVLRRLHAGGENVSRVDANYVREENDIYRKTSNTADAA
jgi:tRNA threonylcarbamoyladenosine biosynthesis protein TsaB